LLTKLFVFCNSLGSHNNNNDNSNNSKNNNNGNDNQQHVPYISLQDPQNLIQTLSKIIM